MSVSASKKKETNNDVQKDKDKDTVKKDMRLKASNSKSNDISKLNNHKNNSNNTHNTWITIHTVTAIVHHPTDTGTASIIHTEC